MVCHGRVPHRARVYCCCCCCCVIRIFPCISLHAPSSSSCLTSDAQPTRRTRGLPSYLRHVDAGTRKLLCFYDGASLGSSFWTTISCPSLCTAVGGDASDWRSALGMSAPPMASKGETGAPGDGNGAAGTGAGTARPVVALSAGGLAGFGTGATGARVTVGGALVAEQVTNPPL